MLTIDIKYYDKPERCIMKNIKEESYIESDREREEGHVDTRNANFDCENKSSTKLTFRRESIKASCT